MRAGKAAAKADRSASLSAGAKLAALPAAYGVARLAVFGPRPKALAALLQKRGMEANTYSLTDALLKGQVSAQAKTPAPTGAVAAPAPAPESATTTPGDAA